jgi:hypothetical protein
LVDAWHLAVSDLIGEKIERNLVIDRAAELTNVGAHLDVLHNLLGAKREQHTKHHHAYFTEKGAPPVQRLDRL